MRVITARCIRTHQPYTTEGKIYRLIDPHPGGKINGWDSYKIQYDAYVSNVDQDVFTASLFKTYFVEIREVNSNITVL